MASLGMKESDIEELFILSSKKGGQKVNKTSACVYLKHRPTGIEVKCQQERSQALNRFLARRILALKIESLVLGKEAEEEKRIEKIRRQKRRRSRRPDRADAQVTIDTCRRCRDVREASTGPVVLRCALHGVTALAITRSSNGVIERGRADQSCRTDARVATGTVRWGW